jgi:ATP-dependent Lhr-like helicase
VLRIYVSEDEVTVDTPPQDQLRAELVQTIATVDLLLERWYEPPSAGGLHLSTLTQQIPSLIAQHGGVTPAEAYRTLCEDGPFHHLGQQTFGALLRALGSAGLLRQECSTPACSRRSSSGPEPRPTTCCRCARSNSPAATAGRRAPCAWPTV